MKIPISKPSLPQLKYYMRHLEQIWTGHHLSNFSKFSRNLEENIASYLQTKNVRAVSSGDLGLIIGLASLCLEKNSEIIVPSFTFNSTVNAIAWNGLVPIFADINPRTLTLDSKDLSQKITKKTKAIVATNVFGNPCDYSSIAKIAKKNSLVFVTDSASAYGSIYRGKKVGTIADIEIFSLSGTKIVTSAEGGFIVAKNKNVLSIVDSIRNYGITKDYNSSYLGINGKISELNAALGCLTVSQVDKEMKKRETLVTAYKKQLSKIKELDFQEISEGNTANNTTFCIFASKRNQLASYLTQHGIQTKIYFRPIHTTSFYKRGDALPNTASVWKKILCLPLFSDMKLNEVNFICQAIKSFYKYA